jgi:phosphoglycolate phosphatase-like HAD superfamily hydrolase
MTFSIIFDMDGTLFQTEKILELSLEDTFNNLRRNNQWDTETPLNLYREIMGVPLPKVWETLLPNHSIEVREQVDSYFLNRLIDNIRNGKGALYPNTVEIFMFLKSIGCDIYIASNGLTEYLKTIVSQYRLDKWVTETCSIEQIGSLHKADLVKSIIEKYKITKGAVVGDRLSDFEAARDNGLISIGCSFDFSRQEELIQADMVIEDLGELKAIIKGLSKQPI